MKKILYGTLFTGTALNTAYIFRRNFFENRYRQILNQDIQTEEDIYTKEIIKTWMGSSYWNQLISSPKLKD